MDSITVMSRTFYAAAELRRNIRTPQFELVRRAVSGLLDALEGFGLSHLELVALSTAKHQLIICTS